MENILDNIQEVYDQLKSDRQKALAEFEVIKTDASEVDKRYRHKAKEVGGIYLKLAIDASIGMSKILEPLIKNQSLASDTSRRELLDLLEDMEDEPKTTKR